jgi:hypothetical protein
MYHVSRGKILVERTSSWIFHNAFNGIDFPSICKVHQLEGCRGCLLDFYHYWSDSCPPSTDSCNLPIFFLCRDIDWLVAKENAPEKVAADEKVVHLVTEAVPIEK